MVVVRLDIWSLVWVVVRSEQSPPLMLAYGSKTHPRTRRFCLLQKSLHKCLRRCEGVCYDWGMTTNQNPAPAPAALSVRHTNEEIRLRHSQQSDLHRLTAKTRAQYEKGLLTLEDLMMELIAIRNSYFDDPEQGTWILDCIRD